MKNFEREDIELLADYFYELFLPRFIHQPEGSLKENVSVEVSKRMTSKIALALLFENKIRLSETYFVDRPHYLPYAMFHEMTHLWLYHCGFDPGHTRRFYRKMQEFVETGYMVDPEVHVHTRLAAESKYVYSCSNCKNRWHVREELEQDIFCGLCWRKEKTKHFAELAHVMNHDLFEKDLDCA